MFTYKEIGVIVAALQTDKTPGREEVLDKIERMVPRKTIQAVIPCIRPTKELDAADRAKVFETERELWRDLQKIAETGKSRVMICVPVRGMVETLAQTVSRCLEIFGPVKKIYSAGKS